MSSIKSNKKKYLISGLIFGLFTILPISTFAANGLAAKLSGMILLDVERSGEAWYVYPVNNKRYYLGWPKDAFAVMRELGLGIREIDFQRLAAAGMPIDGDVELAKKLSGKIILQTEKNGEAWYIYPRDLKKYYLGRPEDAFRVMRELGLGASRESLASVHKNGSDESIDQYSSFKYDQKFSVNGVEYSADVVEIDLANPKLKIITPAATPYPDSSNKERVHGAKSVAKFTFENNGFAGINGSYFESDNRTRLNYYFFPVYDANMGKLINESELKYWTTGPVMAFDVNNKFYYFKDSRDFQAVIRHDEVDGWQIGTSSPVKLAAAIGDKPRLIEEGMNQLIDWEIDKKQFSAKTSRNAIGYKDGKIYLIIVRKTTVLDLAEVLKVMKVEYALNLDGGYSSALVYNGEYMFGPGRDVTNAIVFAEK